MATKLARVDVELLQKVKSKGRTTAEGIRNHVTELEKKASEAVTRKDLRETVKDAVQEALEGMRG